MAVPSGAAKAAEKSAKQQERDRKAAEAHADILVLIGTLREDQRDGYVRGWLNRGFYR